MADIVSTQVISDTSGVKYVVKMTNISDGSGESLVKKIDASETTFMTEDGERKIAKIWWSVNSISKKACVELVMGWCYKRNWIIDVRSRLLGLANSRKLYTKQCNYTYR